MVLFVLMYLKYNSQLKNATIVFLSVCLFVYTSIMGHKPFFVTSMVGHKLFFVTSMVGLKLFLLHP